MKTLIRNYKHILLCALAAVTLLVALAPASAHAQEDDDSANSSCGDARFLGLPAWYNGLAEPRDGGCEIRSPSDPRFGDEGLKNFIWIIVFNIVEMILRLAGYAAVAFIIYGGYKYMTSAGSADGVAAAKKTITNAVVGLVLSIAAVAIVNTISRGLGL